MHDEGGYPRGRCIITEMSSFFSVSPIKTDICLATASEACLCSFQMAAGGEYQSRN